MVSTTPRSFLASSNRFFRSASSCSYISGPEGLFPETKDKFFDEKLSPDLKLPSADVAINKDDHYPPISDGIPAAEVQDIPAPRQIFSSGESNEVQLRRLGELMWVYVETLPSTSWPIIKNYFQASSLSIIDANPDSGIMLINYSDAFNWTKKDLKSEIKRNDVNIAEKKKIVSELETKFQNNDMIRSELNDELDKLAQSDDDDPSSLDCITIFTACVTFVAEKDNLIISSCTSISLLICLINAAHTSALNDLGCTSIR